MPIFNNQKGHIALLIIILLGTLLIGAGTFLVFQARKQTNLLIFKKDLPSNKPSFDFSKASLSQNFISVINDPSRIKFTLTKLATLPEKLKPYDAHLVFSRDGNHFAYSQNGYSTNYLPQNIVLDGKNFDTPVIGPYLFTPDSKSFVYIIQKDSPYLVLPKKTIKLASLPDSFIQGQLIISPDGQRSIFFNGNKVYIDDKVETAPGTLNIFSRPYFNIDSQSYTYVADDYNKHYVVVNGKVFGPYQYTGRADEAIFSPDSKHFAFAAKEANSGYIVVDGNPGTKYEEALYPSFSPDGSKVAFIGLSGLLKTSQNYNLYLNDQKLPGYEGARGAIIFSPDGKRIAEAGYYIDEKNPRGSLILDGKKLKILDEIIGDLQFTPDGKNVVYSGTDKGKDIIGINDQEVPINFRPDKIIISSDSKKIAYFGKIPDSIKIYRYRFGVILLEGNKIINLYSQDQQIYDQYSINVENLELSIPLKDQTLEPIFNSDNNSLSFGALIDRDIVKVTAQIR